MKTVLKTHRAEQHPPFKMKAQVNFSNFSCLKLSILLYSETFGRLHFYQGASHNAAKILKK